MNNFEWLKTQLARRKGQWPIIARETGLTAKTFQNILNVTGYRPNMNTFEKLEKFLRETSRLKVLK